MNTPLTAIGFDADDTLWHNERFFKLTQEHFAALLAEHSEKDQLMTQLLAAERRNLPHYGFGIKGFTLSMIETAIEITKGRVPANVISEILDAGRNMLSHPVELLPHVEQTLGTLRHDHKLILITKGDLLDQTRKIESSGLRDHFDTVEIVSHKTPVEYGTIFGRHATGADQAMMAGNSMASDVVPMIEAGGWGVHVPYGLTWAIEHAETPVNHPRFAQVADLSELPSIVAKITNGKPYE